MENQEKIPRFDFGGTIGKISSDPKVVSDRIKAALDDIPLIEAPKIDNAKIEDGVFECTISLKPVKPLEYVTVETEIEYRPMYPHIEQLEMFDEQ